MSDAITVTNTNDSGDGSLRQAIADIAAGGTITIEATGVISLSSALQIPKEMTIAGPGADQLTLSGQNKVRIFVVRPDSKLGATLSLSGLTMDAANGTNTNGGGAIDVSGGANLNVSGCVISNSTGDRAGGIENSQGGTVTVDQCTFRNNTSSFGAGGFDNSQGGRATITNSTFAGNRGDFSAGAIANSQSSSLTLINCTFSGNQSSMGAGALANSQTSTATVTNCTIAGNSGNQFGAAGGISCVQPGSLVVINGSLVANNPGGDASNNGGQFSGAENLATGPIPHVGSATAGVDYDPNLADNGGPTETLALLAGSKAIDAAPSCTLTTDQRGISRPQGAACDIGAFELS